jgi:TM2 domain-containing membrane protein YozV
MASASFGRKGVEAGSVEPVRRRAAFLTPPAAEPTHEASDPLAKARQAFLASERARARDADDGGAPEIGSSAARTNRAIVVSGKSLGTAYVLWFFLGGFSAHRFYLNTPFTAIAQVCLWYISLMILMAGNGIAVYSLTAGGLWVLADAFLMPRLRDAANEKLRRRAEALQPEPVSP